MNESVKCNINSLENYKNCIIKYYEMQIIHFKELKRKFNNALWNDEKLIFRINEINECLEKIADAINNLTDGKNTKVIDNFLKQSNDYINTLSNYTKK